MADRELTAPQLVAILGPRLLMLTVENELLHQRVQQLESEKPTEPQPDIVEVPSTG